MDLGNDIARRILRGRLGDDRARLAAHVEEASVLRLREGGTMLRPVTEIARRRDAEARTLAVPRGVGHDVESVFRHRDTRVFATAGAIELLLVVSTREEDRLRLARHRDAVLGNGKANARGSAADALVRIVLSAVEDVDLPVLDRRRRIDGVALLPLDRTLLHRTRELRRRIRLDDGIHARGTLETSERPLRQRILNTQGHGPHQTDTQRQNEFIHLIYLLIYLL